MLLSGKDMTNQIPRAHHRDGHWLISRRTASVTGWCWATAWSITWSCAIIITRLSASTGVIQPQVLESNAVKLIEDYDVRTPSPYNPAGKLSGGNQQKVIVARELSRPVKLLIANQPTRGLDVGSIEYIHKEIVAMRDRGVAVLLVSAELDEIMALSDRIAVMYRGQIVTTVPAGEVTREQLGVVDGRRAPGDWCKTIANTSASVPAGTGAFFLREPNPNNRR